MILKYLSVICLCLGITFSAVAQENPLKNELDSVSYSLGLNVAQNMKRSGFTEINTELLKQAMDDVLGGKPFLLQQSSVDEIIRTYMQNMHQKRYEPIIEKGRKFLEENKQRPSVVQLPSGLQYEVIQKGTGVTPTGSSRVTVHYEGTFIDGSVFDSSIARGQPATFQVNGVISGWTEALKLMRQGSKWRLYIPYQLAYGEQGTQGGIGPYETLVFEVELLSVEN